MTLPLLYSFRRCPSAIRARMAIWQARVPVQLHEVSLRAKPASLLAVSPKGTVPVLVLPGPTPQVIEQSLDIMQWALRQNDPDGWLAAAETTDVTAWLERNDVQFKPLLDRYKYAVRHPELSPAAHRQRAVDGHVAALDACLSQQPFLAGDRASWVDVALFPFLRQFAAVDPDWFAASSLAGAQRWLAYWAASPVMSAVMQR